MPEFTKEVFEQTAEAKGLTRDERNNKVYYSLEDCNLLFEFDEITKQVITRSKISLPLAHRLYESIIALDPASMKNDSTNNLVLPASIAVLPSTNIAFTQTQTGMSSSEADDKWRSRIIANNARTCYLDYHAISTNEAFILFIDTVEADRQRLLASQEVNRRP